MKDPLQCLGTGGQARSIRQRSFFRSTVWRALQGKTVMPPHKSQIVNLEELPQHNVHEEPEQHHQGRVCLGHYELISHVASRAYGQVMLAKMNSTGNRSSSEALVALKIVPHVRMSSVEKEVLLQAVGHPFIVQLVSYFQTETSVCYVMELLEGGTLYSMLHELKRLPEAAARLYSEEIILAVSFLHNCRVYGDIHTGSILLDKDGHCRLADFGVSKILFQQKQKSRECETWLYITFECWTSNAVVSYTYS